MNPLDHYTSQAVVAAAMAWHRASTDAEVDAASDALHAAVERWLSVTAPRTPFEAAHMLLAEAVAR